MKTLSAFREWLFPIAVLLGWSIGASYTLVRLGEAHRLREVPAVTRAAPEKDLGSPFLARAE